MSRQTAFPMAVAAILVAGAAGMPLASAEEDHASARKLREAGQILSLEAIAERARTARSGQVLEAELEKKASGYVYEVEVLDEDGTVWELKLDAKSGDLIDMRMDD